MLVWFAISSLLVLTLADDKHWTVKLDQGEVKGEKFWNGDYYEFYAIPYATVPQGRDRYKAPLPPRSWEGPMDGSEKNKYIMCHQLIAYDAEPNEEMVIGQEECLLADVLVHEKAKDGQPLPVIVYFHGGAYAVGYSSMTGFQNLLKHEVIIVSFNFRIGPLGFLCLGTEEIPGNAALKDQVEMLKWVKNNIGAFNGNPDDVTIAGYTTGASLVDILMLSGAADGLFNKVIADSGSALSPWAVDLDPVNTAINIAKFNGYEGENINDLTEFYMSQSIKSLMAKSAHIWNKNSTFAFAPCVEKKLDNVDNILTESPYKILKSGKFKNVPILTGFSNMEGISRLDKLDEWREQMDENFSDFLPADIHIEDEQEKNEVIGKIKEIYFEGKTVEEAHLQGFVDYFSDSMFSTSMIRSAQLHSVNNPVYLYEFSYYGALSTQHYHPQTIVGASHRDQTAYILNFGLGFTRSPMDLHVRARLTAMWTNFAYFGQPIPETDFLLDEEWKTYTEENPNYLSINEDLELRSSPIPERAKFWNDIYRKYYREPIPPNPETARIKVKKVPEKPKKVDVESEKVKEELKKKADAQNKMEVETEKVKEEFNKKVTAEQNKVEVDSEKVKEENKKAAAQKKVELENEKVKEELKKKVTAEQKKVEVDSEKVKQEKKKAAAQKKVEMQNEKVKEELKKKAAAQKKVEMQNEKVKEELKKKAAAQKKVEANSEKVKEEL